MKMNNASSPLIFNSTEELLEEIRETIKDRPGLSQAKLAKRLHMSRGNLNRILCGQQTLNIETLREITDCLGIKVLL